MGLLTWVLVGLVAGVIAQFVVGGGVGSPRGLVIAILLGIGGAVLGGFVSSAMGWGDVTGFNIRSLVIASLGAIVVVLIWQQLSKRNSR